MIEICKMLFEECILVIVQFRASKPRMRMKTLEQIVDPMSVSGRPTPSEVKSFGQQLPKHACVREVAKCLEDLKGLFTNV